MQTTKEFWENQLNYCLKEKECTTTPLEIKAINDSISEAKQQLLALENNTYIEPTLGFKVWKLLCPIVSDSHSTLPVFLGERIFYYLWRKLMEQNLQDICDSITRERYILEGISDRQYNSYTNTAKALDIYLSDGTYLKVEAIHDRDLEISLKVTRLNQPTVESLYCPE